MSGSPLHLELVAHAVHHPHTRQPGQGHQPQRLRLRESEGDLLQSGCLGHSRHGYTAGRNIYLCM